MISYSLAISFGICFDQEKAISFGICFWFEACAALDEEAGDTLDEVVVIDFWSEAITNQNDIMIF